MEAQPPIIADREHALRTCPAQAPDAPHDESLFDDDEYDLRANAVADELYPVVDLAREYLSDCPRDQPGDEPGLDLGRRRVFAQVTYGGDQVLSDLQARLEDPRMVTVELVRYSAAQLEQWAEQIWTLPDDVGICGVGTGNGNSRIEVDVWGDADEAWRRIAAIVDPAPSGRGRSNDRRLSPGPIHAHSQRPHAVAFATSAFAAR